MSYIARFELKIGTKISFIYKGSVKENVIVKGFEYDSITWGSEPEILLIGQIKTAENGKLRSTIEKYSVSKIESLRKQK